MKLAIIHADPSVKISARLTLWATGSTAYHCGFVCEETNTFYDMNLLPRKLHWPRYQGGGRWVNLYEVPNLTRDHCEEFLKEDGTIRYGVLDYILFGLRPIYHIFGMSTRNASGMICSEMCALWLRRVGYYAPEHPVPSPADMEAWAVGSDLKSEPAASGSIEVGLQTRGV